MRGSIFFNPPKGVAHYDIPSRGRFFKFLIELLGHRNYKIVLFNPSCFSSTRTSSVKWLVISQHLTVSHTHKINFSSRFTKSHLMTFKWLVETLTDLKGLVKQTRMIPSGMATLCWLMRPRPNPYKSTPQGVDQLGHMIDPLWDRDPTNISQLLQGSTN